MLCLIWTLMVWALTKHIHFPDINVKLP